MSRIGRKPIVLPSGAKLELKDGLISVSGPKGSLSRKLLEGLELSVDGNTVVVQRLNEDKKIKGAFMG